MIRFLLFCLALGLGFYGALTGSAVSLLLAVLVMFVVSVRFTWWTAKNVTAPDNSWQRKVERHGWWLIAFSGVGAAAIAAYQSRLDPFDRGSSYFWGVGLVLVLVAGYLHDHKAGQQSSTTGVAQAKPPLVVNLHFGRVDWLLMIALAGVALWLRLHQLNDVLPTMHGDEGEMGDLARWALHGPSSTHALPLPLFTTGFLNHPTLFHYLQALALFCFGDTLTGLRTLSAIFGALCAATIYAVGKVGWGRVAGVTAGWLLAVSHLHIHYSRIALNNIQSVWFTILFFLVLLIGVARTTPYQREGTGLAERPLLPYTFLGLIIGLSQYFYYGSRLIPVLAMVLMLILLGQRRLSFAQLSGAILATLIAYAPLALYYSQDIRAFLNRTQGVSVFNPEGLVHTLGAEAKWPADIPWLLWSQIKENIAFFINIGDASSFYLADLPAFDPLTIALFWLGIGVVLARIRRFQETALTVWFVLGLLLAGVLTNDAPNGPRLIVMVSAMYLVGGVLVERIYHAAMRVWTNTGRWLTMIALVILALGTLQMNYHTYFVTYAHLVPNNMPISMAHMIATNQDGYRFYLFGAPHFYAEYSVLRFIAPQSERYNVMLVDDIPPPLDAAGKGIMAIVFPDRIPLLDEVEARWPGGIRAEQKDQLGRLLYLTYRWPAAKPVVTRPDAASETDAAGIEPEASPLAVPTAAQ